MTFKYSNLDFEAFKCVIYDIITIDYNFFIIVKIEWILKEVMDGSFLVKISPSKKLEQGFRLNKCSKANI